MICPNCKSTISDNAVFCTACGSKISTPTQDSTPYSNYTSSGAGVNFDFSDNTTTAIPCEKKTYQYKVLSQKDKWFSGKFDPTVLEQAINAYAQQGWRVVGCATGAAA